MPTDQNIRPASGSEHQAPITPPRHKGVRAFVWIIVLLVFAGGFYLVLRKRDASATAAKSPRGGGGPVSLVTATAKQGDIGVYLDSIGTVTPVYTASITSQVNGIVTAVHYKEGQLVRKGDPLIDIDARPYQASLLQAQGTLERDTNLLAMSKMDLQRYRDAWARNAIPKQTLDDQDKLVLQQQGTLKFDEGVVQFDQIQVDYCHIVSPISGRVGLRLVDPGNVVQSSGTLTLAVVTQIQPITVIFTVPEDNLGQVQQRLRKNAKLNVDAFDRSALKQLASGMLLTLDNQIDTTTGTVKARGSFDNKDAALFPNEFVNVRLLVDTHRGATLIPSSTIQHNGQTAFVYVLQDNVAHMRTIQPGVTDAGTTEVTGIAPGDVLANSSFDKLQDNAKVVVSSKPIPGNNAGSAAP
ncbi:MAG TPA: efflux RND transporter periplasmic adaptor subunit [Candidatus Acidoferrales bacterium]|nr:efflux RND transporter periplasmic adaptor subunit [Candidatus Acidoferrales bacterium]